MATFSVARTLFGVSRMTSSMRYLKKSLRNRSRDRALPRLRLRRDFFKYLIDDVILDTPNSVRATLNVAMVN